MTITKTLTITRVESSRICIWEALEHHRDQLVKDDCEDQVDEIMADLGNLEKQRDELIQLNPSRAEGYRKQFTQAKAELEERLKPLVWSEIELEEDE